MESGNCELIWNGDNSFEVGYNGKIFIIDLGKRT